MNSKYIKESNNLLCSTNTMGFCLVSVNSEGPGKLGLKRRNFAPTTRGKVHNIPYNLLEK
jgi:hypothetical protein